MGSGRKLGITTRADGAADGAAVDGEIVGPNVVGAADGASVKGYAVSNTANVLYVSIKEIPIIFLTNTTKVVMITDSVVANRRFNYSWNLVRN